MASPAATPSGAGGPLSPRTPPADANMTSSSSSSKVSVAARRSMTSREVACALSSAKSQATRYHLRVRLPILIAGVFMTVLAVLFRIFEGEDDLVIFCGQTVRNAATALILLALLPSDRWAIRLVTVLNVMMWASVVYWHCLRIAKAFARADVKWPDLKLCEFHWGSNEPCRLQALNLPSFAAYLSVSIWMVWYLLSGIAKPPRVVLQRLWFSTCCAFWAVGLIFLVGLPATVLLMYRGVDMEPYRIPVDICRVILNLGGGLLLSWSKLRRRLMFCLQYQSGEVTAAATIAAFIGGLDTDAVMEAAQLSCRYVPLDKVAEADMRCPTPDPALGEYAVPCKLTDLDAFLSHSWHDPPDEKWAALQGWRAAFKARHGREPRVWIDKYCIDQCNVQASLMCLPVFLAGCQHLLILAGPTYLSRLWCVEEVFIYLQMGRDAESIEVRALSSDLCKQIERFTVDEAHCHLDKDEATLRATIEAGCCTLEAFDSQVRSALQVALSFCQV